MSCAQARHEFDFCVEDGGALGLGEAAHLIVGEGDVVFDVLRQTGRCAVTVGRSDDNIALPMVEASRIIACRLLATALNLPQYLYDCGGDIGVFAGGAPRCLLEISHVLPVTLARLTAGYHCDHDGPGDKGPRAVSDYIGLSFANALSLASFATISMYFGSMKLCGPGAVWSVPVETR